MIDKIRSAFRSEPVPGLKVVGIAASDPELGFLVKTGRGGYPSLRRYTDITEDEYDVNATSLFFLKGRALEYYLPGFMIACLKLDPAVSQIHGCLLRLPIKIWPADPSTVPRLSDDQFDCVREFLVVLDGWQNPTLGRDPQKALNSISNNVRR